MSLSVSSLPPPAQTAPSCPSSATSILPPNLSLPPSPPSSSTCLFLQLAPAACSSFTQSIISITNYTTCIIISLVTTCLSLPSPTPSSPSPTPPPLLPPLLPTYLLNLLYLASFALQFHLLHYYHICRLHHHPQQNITDLLSKDSGEVGEGSCLYSGSV